MIAHIGGVPLEEALLPLVSAGGSGLLLAVLALAGRSRRSVGARVRAVSVNRCDAGEEDQ